MALWALVACALAAVAGALVAWTTPRRLLAQRLHADRTLRGRPKTLREMASQVIPQLLSPGSGFPAEGSGTGSDAEYPGRVVWRPGVGSRASAVLGTVIAVVLGSGLVVVLTTVVGIAVIGVVVVGVAGVVLSVRSWRARAARARQDVRRRGVLELCDALSAELLAGKSPRHALPVVARLSSEQAELVSAAVSACRTDQDVAAALRSAEAPGAEGLAQIAAAWEVADDSGAALAEVLDRVSRSLRDEQELRREVVAELAAPRATARLLAVLPLFGLGLGAATGTDPLGVLLGTPYGLACLIVGVGLTMGGLAWVERLARRAEAR